jgi:hypothetical protein
MKTIEKLQKAYKGSAVGNEDGIAGYVLGWLLGVPLSVLIIIYLFFGH